MTRERYERLMCRFRGPHERLWILCFRRAPYVLALGYALLCLYVMFVRRDIAVRVIGVPAAVFALTSALRAAIDRPRPYDALGYTPLLPHRSRKGRSLPSRHAACAVVIACAMAYASAPLALPAGAMAATRPFSTRTSAGLRSTSMSSGNTGSTSTPANVVWRRFLSSVGEMRTRRCTPFSLFSMP